MIKYAKVINQNTKEVAIYEGNSKEYIKLYGVFKQEVEQAYNGHWYLAGYCPEKPEPSTEEQVLELESQTGLTREIRELILMNNLETSDYVKERVLTIESMANVLRKS